MSIEEIVEDEVRARCKVLLRKVELAHGKARRNTRMLERDALQFQMAKEPLETL